MANENEDLAKLNMLELEAIQNIFIMRKIDLFAYGELARRESITQKKVSSVTGFAIKKDEEQKEQDENANTNGKMSL